MALGNFWALLIKICNGPSLSLSQGHMKQKNGGRRHSGGPFRPKSSLSQSNANWREYKSKKKKKVAWMRVSGVAASVRVGCW